MDYELVPEALQQFGNLPKPEKARVLKKIEWMVDNWPQSRGDALERNLKGLEKLRAGNYRIIYRVSGEMITIERIGDRKDVYGHGD